MAVLYLHLLEVSPDAEAIVTDINLGSYSGTLLTGFNPTGAAWDATTGGYEMEVDESLTLFIHATTADAVAQAVNDIERMIEKARLRGYLGYGNRVFLKVRPDGMTLYRTAEIVDGRLELQPVRNMSHGEAVAGILTLKRRGLCFGDEVALTIDSPHWTGLASTVVWNHYDGLAYIYDYDDNASGTPWTGGAYSANRYNTYPVTLFAQGEAVDEVGDGCYFGDAYTFEGLLFDLGTAEADTCTFVWEYWDGAAWTALVHVGGDFDTTGKVRVHWPIPGDWATCAINGATCYWARRRCSAFDTYTTSPRTQTDMVRSSHANFIDIPAAQIKGSVGARCRIEIVNDLVAQDFDVLRMAIRTLHDPLNYTGMEEFSGTAETTASGGAYDTAAIGNDGLWDSIAATTGADDATDTQGLSRVFVRAYAVGADDGDSMELRIRNVFSGTATLIYTDHDAAPIEDDDVWVLVDCGILDESGSWVPEAYPISTTNVYVEGRWVTSGTDIRIDYLMRMPVDECYLTFPTGLALLGNVEDRELWIDTISPAAGASIVLADAALKPAAYRGKLPVLRPNKLHRIYFSFDRAGFINAIEDQLTIKVYARPQYLTLAGY